MADSALAKIEDLLHPGENLSAADLGAETIGEKLLKLTPSWCE